MLFVHNETLKIYNENLIIFDYTYNGVVDDRLNTV